MHFQFLYKQKSLKTTSLRSYSNIIKKILLTVCITKEIFHSIWPIKLLCVKALKQQDTTPKKISCKSSLNSSRFCIRFIGLAIYYCTAQRTQHILSLCYQLSLVLLAIQNNHHLQIFKLTSSHCIYVSYKPVKRYHLHRTTAFLYYCF